MIKRFLILLWVAVMTVGVHANVKVKITGTVTDENKEALIGATVRLTSGDSLTVSLGTTDAKGRFAMKDIADGDYTLTISFIGYDDNIVKLAGAGGDIDLGQISMTPASSSLQEVTVTASSTTQRFDRQIVVPTQLQVKAANNGFALIRNMQLSGIIVNTVDNSVKTATGDDVQLRINGVETNIAEVKAVRPENIVRVEYHDMPGLRYNGAKAVIDIIVKYKNNGGNVAADITQGITNTGLTDANLSANWHKNNSELKAVAYWTRRDLTWTRSNTETFNTGTHTFTNTEVGMPTDVKFDNLALTLGYNHTFGKNRLSITLRDRLNDMPNSTQDRKSTMYREDGTFSVDDHLSQNEHSPSLDVYFQTELKNNQHLYFDLVGTYINSSSDRLYSLTGATDNQSIRSTTDGDKYSLIGEGIYEWTFKNNKLSFGLRHSQMYTRNTYNSDGSTLVKMNTSETYAYGEFMSRVKRFTSSVGLGAMRTYNNQEGNTMERYIARPTVTLSYDFAKNMNVRYHGYMSGYSPSLSDMSDVSQDIDIYQTRRGNPNLKSATFVSNELSLSWNSPRLSMQLSGRYSYDDKPIMEETFYENGRFIRTMANQKGFHRINTSVSIQARPFDWLSVQVAPFFNRFISYGNSYTHTHSNWGVNGQLLAMYKNWVMMASVNTSYHDLWGENLSKGEAGHNIAFGYNTEKWSLQMMIANPFTKTYRTETEKLSAIASSRLVATSKDFRRFVLVNFSFNINYGKSKNPSSNRISNSDTDAGIMYGR